MNLHEYQAKELLRRYDVPLPRGRVAFSLDEANDAAMSVPGFPKAVKAQIHAGGRGKGGGVKIVNSIEEAQNAAKEILGMTLVTPQTGAEGRVVRRLYVEEGVQLDREFYLSLLVDRSTARLTFIVSKQGGMNIEEVAAKNPEAIFRFPVPSSGMGKIHGIRIGEALNLDAHSAAAEECSRLAVSLYEAFMENDLSLVEINPLGLLTNGHLSCLDAKVTLDDNALFRHSNLLALRDLDEENPTEIEADSHGLNYIQLDGSIGCMVNGAGLAMATMDIIHLHGCSPANFLDVGGGASGERVAHAFRILLSDGQIRGILVNVFGGITRCDDIARGITQAAQEVQPDVPLVVRLAGTNAREGLDILAQSDLDITTAADLEEAAEKIADLAGREPGREEKR
ncbi:MAG: ADP-forming succinate--CoA ligase subunit beta [Hyphomicrobiales bacterium]|nr:ADP-forming succinate--CoA ligase subunit beta [Hyphomicrobiales bacterium]MCY4049267.1 ADP-forming succinate--CoA ligase subunit beta [Hyphomicrobiales bacterium]MCY4053173.1 ADP-forming succinate--CoA ligase subunit beta [Hyphomicrobiales bacterium]